MRARALPRRDRLPAGAVRVDTAPTTWAGPDRRAGTPTTPWADVSMCVSRRAPRPVISVIGALDVSGAALLSAMLDHVRRTEGLTPEVDLSRVDYADSHGLAPLLDDQVAIRRASPVVERVLALLCVPGPTSPEACLTSPRRPVDDATDRGSSRHGRAEAGR